MPNFIVVPVATECIKTRLRIVSSFVGTVLLTMTIILGLRLPSVDTDAFCGSDKSQLHAIVKSKLC